MDCLNSKASRSFAVGAKALGRNSEKANLKHSRQFLDFGKLIQYCLSAHPWFFFCAFSMGFKYGRDLISNILKEN